MADLKDINEKIEKIQKKIDTLMAQRNELDIKIKNKQEELDKYVSILNQKKFDEMQEVLTAKGLTVNELIAAVKNGDIASLQEHLEANNKEVNIEASTLLNSGGNNTSL